MTVKYPPSACRYTTLRKLAVLAAALWTQGILAATEPVGETSATVTHLSGILTAVRSDGTTKLLSVNSDIREGDKLKTQQETYARIKFRDGAEIVLRPNSELKIDSYSYSESQPAKDNFAVSLIKGGLRAVTGLLGRRSKEKTSFNTSTATIGIRGTHFGALLCADDCSSIPTVSGKLPENGLHVDVAAGGISLTNSAGTQNLEAGQFGFARNSFSAPTVVPSELGIRIGIPPSISNNRTGGRSIGPDEGIECAP